MRIYRSILPSALSLAILAGTVSGALAPDRDRPLRTDIFHRNGRVAANLPPDGTISQAWYEETLAGLRWPGIDGVEFAGSGGFYLRYRVAGDEVDSYISPGDFSLVEEGSAGLRLCEGCRGGRRYPAEGCDDDGDGLVDEDPFDGTDNDGDGSIDEDFNAIGHSMAVTRAGVPGTGLFMTQSSYVWSFGHVKDFIAFSTKIDYLPADPDAAMELLDFGAALAVDLDIGDPGDIDRGEDDSFFFMRRSGPSAPGEGNGPAQAGPSTASGFRFAMAGGGKAERAFAAVILLGATFTGVTEEVPIVCPVASGPASDPKVSFPAIRPSGYDVRDIWDGLAARRTRDGGGTGIDTEGDSSREKAVEYVPEGDFEKSGGLEGDYSIINAIADVPRLGPGEGVRIDWAVVFGRTPGRLAVNAERAVETYRGVRGGDGRWNRWIVPARKAVRIEVEARLAPVWLQGRRMPAVSIELPPGNDEEVEWLRIAADRIENFEQVEGRVLATISPELVEKGDPLFAEGQLSDGTIFRSTISAEEIELFAGDDSVAPDKLPEDCLKTFPNPFVLDLNISLNVEESSSQLYRSGDGASSGISSVRIYDVKGRLVRTILEEEFLHPGEYTMGWDGKDENGMQVQPGVYYCKLQIGDRSVTKRVVLLR